MALGAVAAAAWIAADLAGYGYGLGFVGAAEGSRAAIGSGTEAPFQLFLALGVVAGAALAGPRRPSLPDGPRATRAAAGGVLMGAGGSIAHG
jgi:Sulphur transport